MKKRMIRLDGAESAMRVHLAALMADVVTGGIDECRQEGVPLNALQERTLLRNAAMAYATIVGEAMDSLEVEARLAEGLST